MYGPGLGSRQEPVPHKEVVLVPGKRWSLSLESYGPNTEHARVSIKHGRPRASASSDPLLACLLYPYVPPSCRAAGHAVRMCVLQGAFCTLATPNTGCGQEAPMLYTLHVSMKRHRQEHGCDTVFLGEITNSTFIPQIFPARTDIGSRQTCINVLM